MSMGLFDIFKTKQSEQTTIKPRRFKALIIDDDHLLRKFYYDLLETNNFEAYAAAGGHEGLVSIQQNRPDVVLLDIIMPDMDGKQVLKELRAKPDTAKLPVIMLTSAASVTNMDETKMFAANAFLNKSTVTPEEIMSTIRDVLSTKPKLLTSY
jgi:DNA-binding response OmpR family regulator